MLSRSSPETPNFHRNNHAPTRGCSVPSTQRHTPNTHSPAGACGGRSALGAAAPLGRCPRRGPLCRSPWVFHSCLLPGRRPLQPLVGQSVFPECAGCLSSDALALPRRLVAGSRVLRHLDFQCRSTLSPEDPGAAVLTGRCLCFVVLLRTRLRVREVRRGPVCWWLAAGLAAWALRANWWVSPPLLPGRGEWNQC